MSGYFFSPLFPGYYLDDMFCTWYITVPSGYVIHLELQEFRLKYHSKCENCFLQIFDGNGETAPTIGRFCGYVYPPVLISSSNHFTIVVNCSGNLHKARFKAFYHSTDGKCCVTFYLHKSQNQFTYELFHIYFTPRPTKVSYIIWGLLVECFKCD